MVVDQFDMRQTFRPDPSILIRGHAVRHSYSPPVQGIGHANNWKGRLTFWQQVLCYGAAIIRSFAMIATIAFALFVLLNVTEGILNYRIIEGGGKEGNPAMRWAVDKLGSAPAIVFSKVIIVAVVLFLVALMPDMALSILVILCAA